MTSAPADPTPASPGRHYLLTTLLTLAVLAFITLAAGLQPGWKMVVLGAACWLAALRAGKTAKLLLLAGAILGGLGCRVNNWYAERAAEKAVLAGWAAVKSDCIRSFDKGRYEDAIECFDRLLKAGPTAPDAGEIAGKRAEAAKLNARLIEEQKARRLQEESIIGPIVQDFLGARQANIIAMGGNRVIMKNVSYTYAWTKNDNSRFLADGTCDVYTTDGKLLNTTNWKFEGWKDRAGTWKHTDRTRY